MTDDPARPSDPTSTNETGDPLETSRMSFGDHLDELRDCLIRALLGLMVGAVVALFFGKDILELIYRPLLRVQYANGLTPQLQVLAPTAAFTAYLKIGLLAGLILSAPWVLHQLWRFVAIGLYKHERRFVRLLLPTSVGLFTLGVLFFYFIVLPAVLHFFVLFNKTFATPDLEPTALQRLLLPSEQPAVPSTPLMEGVKVPVLLEDPPEPETGDVWINATMRRMVVQTESGPLSTPMEPGTTPRPMQSQFAIDFYVSFVLMLALAFGIAFETPVVVFFLAWSGIVTTDAMIRGRKYVLLATVFAAAMLTPPDVISQLLLAGPMYLLFELGVRVATLVERKNPGDGGG